MAGLLLGACSSDSSDSTGSGDGTTTGMGSTSTGAMTSATTATGAGPTSNGSMSASATTGSSTTGAATTTGVGATTTATVNSSSSASSGGSGTEGTGGTGATLTTSGGGATTTGAGGTGGVVECTRELLSSRLDEYFAALAAGDASTLALAANLKFTENAQATEIGTTEFWMNADEVKYSQSALDTEQCMVAAHAVVPENDTDLPIAVRIKLDAGEMSEIETIVVRPGDYTASFAVPSNPQAIIDIANDVGWHDVVPEGDRATREQLTSWINKYFRFFPSGVCNVTGQCRRLENGGGNFGCNAGAMCNPGEPGTNDDNLVPRLILADVERGITVGLTILEGHLDMHMAKMSGGSVHAVHAILRDTNGQSGWD